MFCNTVKGHVYFIAAVSLLFSTSRRADSMCTQHVYDFASALLYSVETQTTLGYGSRVTNPACAQSLALLIVQLVVGAAIDCVIAGLVFDKLTRPQRRSKITWFSRRAVIFRRPDDRSYCLALRVWYRGKSPLMSAAVRAVFIPSSGFVLTCVTTMFTGK
jgi:potassium inwardly-rectifying channel subfamily J